MADAETRNIYGPTHPVGDFNRLISRYWEAVSNERDMSGTKAEIDGILASFPDSATREAFLWESIRIQIIDGSRRAMDILASPGVSAICARITSLSPEELDTLPRDERETLKWFDDLSTLKEGFAGVSLDLYDPESDGQYHGYFDSYPYESLRMLDNLEMTRLCANLGHDLHAIPALSYFAMSLVANARAYEEERRRHNQNEPGPTHLGVRILPRLHQGASWMFEAFADMAGGSFPREDADLTEVLSTVADEAAARAFGNNHVLVLKYAGTTYRNPYLDTPKKISIPEFTIDTHIAPDLKLPGNESGLHLLFYQFVKNTVIILQQEDYQVKKPEVTITADQCVVSGQPCIAVRISDNGPGLDFAAILRSKQTLLRHHFDHLTPEEQRIAGDWTSLDLRLVDIVKFMFDRRVSGSERTGAPHSGIGMALAKELVESHGGTIWATNVAADTGAKFLILLDPSGNGNLRNAAPELYQTDTVPAEILTDIDRQLTQVENR